MKYIIEIKPEYEDNFKGLMILGAKDSNLFVDTLAVENLEELNSDYINENFGDLQDTAYQRGLEDGKAQSERGCEGCRFDGTRCIACENCCNSHMNHWTAKQTDDEIKVGDEVINNTTGSKGILLEPETKDMLAVVIIPSQRWRTFNSRHSNLKKTGKHYDIEDLLKVMNGVTE